ncbi:MAG: FixH family protein [Fibrobacterota bacterium]
MSKKILGGLLAVSLSILSGCESATKPQDPAPSTTAGLKLLGTYTSSLHGGKLQAKVWIHDSLVVGWNELEVELSDPRFKDSLVHDAHVKPIPYMTMATMSHAAPYEVLSTPESDPATERFVVADVFTMPSGDMGSWVVKFRVHDHRFAGTADSVKQNDTVVIPVTVKQPTLAKLFTFKGPDSIKRVVAMRKPASPVVGLNDLEFTVHKMKDMMSFPADTGAKVAFDPTMPSMGHGSPNNVQPAHVGKGHFTGKANFTMTGDWRLSMTISDSTGAVQSSGKYFDLLVK